MNQGLYQLVFSKLHNAIVVVAEIASSCAGQGRQRARRARAIWLALTLLPAPWAVMTAWAELPAGIEIRDAVNAQGVINNATQITSSSANHINFQQLVPQAIVNYNKLNLDRGQSFNVDMQAGWSMLNRVHSVDPSVLNGNVNAAGNIYFINANGVIIGRDAVFNVGSLFAGTLNITDELFKSGFINDSGYNSVFELVDTLNLPADQASRIQNAQVTVESGARINAASGGKVMLFAPNVRVENNALIKTPDGQTILAAGQKIYLKGSQDPAGMLVEVASGGTATNLGEIVAARGNITMMGLAVNQMGKLSATTSVRANGSIKLIAQDDVTVNGGAASVNRNGIVTLGTGSVTEVKPEMDDKEEMLASLAFKTSDISMEASLFNIDGLVSAKGGNISISTQASVNAAAGLNSNIAQRIYLGEHATLDVSGVDAMAPVSRFQLTVQLNSDALKDNPLLRDSNLFGKTVYVDARKGTDLFDLQPYINSTRMATVAERMTNAGTVTLSNQAEIIAVPGSVINVSGGTTTYTEGTLKESQLFYNGELVPISKAQVGVAYTGIADAVTIQDTKWGTIETFPLGNLSYRVQSFTEGNDAGAVRAVTPVNNGLVEKLALHGTLLGNTRPSALQIQKNQLPQGAELIASAAHLDWVSRPQNLLSGFTFGGSLNGGANYQSEISTDFLTQGFNRIDFGDVANLRVNAAVTLDPNGTLTLSRAGNTTVQVNQNIRAAGSDIQLNAGLTSIADGVTVSTAGRFDNNKASNSGALTRPQAENAGSINAGIVSFGRGVTLDASAGAVVDKDGGLHTGDAGNISFTTDSQLPSDLTLRAYGFDQGGELNVQFGQGRATQLYIGAGNIATDGSTFAVDNAFFSQGGFSKYHLGAFNIDVGSANGSQPSLIYGVAQTLQMKSGYTAAKAADSLLGLTRLTTLPDYKRQAVSFDFATYRVNDSFGVLNVHENAHIKTDPLGSIRLLAGKQVNVLGDLTAHGGVVTLSLNDVDTDLPEDPTQMVFIGDQAKVDVSGTVIAQPSASTRLINNQVVNGGSILVNSLKERPTDASISNKKGGLVIKQGAVLDVSGTSAFSHVLTNQGYVGETLYGDAGSMTLNGFGSLLVDGTLSGHASGTGRGGSLTLAFEGVPYDGLNYPNDSGRFWLTNQQQGMTSGLQAGDALKGDINAPVTADTARLQRAQISAAQIESGGFDNVHLATYIINTAADNSRLMLAPDVDLSIAGNLVLETPVLQVADNGAAQLSAGHLQLQSRKFDVDPALAGGTGSLALNANQIYIDGLLATSGVNRTTLHAQRDIHGQGLNTLVQGQASASVAGLSSQGELNLVARQIYPDSGAALTFTATGSQSQINVSSSGLAATDVLSGGGVLTLQADNIVQAGVLKAPFGQIRLDAPNVTLATGSLTSVSGSGLTVPFGTTTSSGELFNPIGGVSQKPVEKEIVIGQPGSQVVTQEGATVDLSGGGELFAYEWISGGVGGTQDILAQPNTYALIPALKGDYAPTDLNYKNSSAAVETGQTIYITGVAGIPTGTYTLLPARYALVPGAFIVQRSDVALVRGQTSALQDGSQLTTGYMADLNTGAKDAQWSTFRVMDGNILRPASGTVSKAPSQYVVTNASDFFSDPLKTNGVDVKNTQDAGKLTLLAQQLVLDATVVANKLTGADGLVVDISADRIRVMNTLDQSDQSSLQLLAGKLNALNADSILLGGTRSLVNGVTTINTLANTVSIENDASHSLRTVEFLATALGSVNMLPGAVINTGAAAAQPKQLTLTASGDGAFLGLSSLNQLQFTRTGSGINAASGVLNIAAGSQLNAGNALVMDGSQQVGFEGDITLAEGADVTLGSNRILLGEVPANESGLQVSDQTLAQLDNVNSLTLNSYSTIDTYGSVEFGNDRLNLTMNAAGIAGHLAAGESVAPANQTVTIHSQTLTLKNSVDANYTAPADASGRTLVMNAGTVKLQGDAANVLDNGAVASADRNTLGGFDAVQINAKALTVAERGALDLQVAQTQLNVGRISTETGASYTLNSSGALTTTQGNASGLSANTQMGGHLTLQADQLTVNSRLEALAGQVNLQAGSLLQLGSQAAVSAASASKVFAGKTTTADAGQVRLSSGGDIVIDSGAQVNVSAQGDADAGQVSLSAVNGNIQLQGQLDGRALGTGQGGSLTVDVAALPSVSALDAQAVGFSQSRSYRVRTGDVSIDGNGAQALTAQQIVVSADQGAIDVSGTVNANSDKSGSIALYAQGDLTLQANALLTANSTQAGAEGGKVTLATASGALSLNQGSAIQVAGGSGGLGGEVHLRAPRTGSGSGNGVAVNSLDTSITGAQSTVLEAFRVYNNVSTITTGTGTGSTLGFTTLANDVSAFMANKSSILASLGKSADSNFHLQAGQEIRSRADGNLQLSSDWNLYSAPDANTGVSTRAGAEPGVLTLRSAGNLTLNGSLSDGFNGTAANAALGAGTSWSYRLVAGADTTAANVMDTVVAAQDGSGNSVSGNILLGNGKLIRTGTGDISLAAGGDLRMGNTSSVIYTSGVKASTLAGFTSPDAAQLPLYLTQGGDISITVKGSIAGAETDERQLINQWLFRQGSSSLNKDTSWWVRPDQFKQSLAALGGGNVRISADGNIANFSASVPTTGRYDNFGSSPTGNSSINGGGDLSVVAGGDIYSGVYFVGKGDGVIKAGGSITAQDGNSYGTALALMEGHFEVSAGKNVLIEGTYNPTLLPQSTVNEPNNRDVGQNSQFSTYSETASVQVQAVNGSIDYATHPLRLPGTATGLKSIYNYGLSLTPGTLDMVAYNGALTLGEAWLMPAAQGNVTLLAEQDIGISRLLMSDANVTDIPNVQSPVFAGYFQNYNLLTQAFSNHANSLLHAADTTPAMIVSRNGSVLNVDAGVEPITNTVNPGPDEQGRETATVIALPKMTTISAGQDISGLYIALQNNRSSDVSVLSAARDINTKNVVIAGPGNLLMEAGRNINLIFPDVTTVEATGNNGTANILFDGVFASRANTALPSTGSSIMMLAGQGTGAQVQAYIDRYIAPAGAGPAVLANNGTGLTSYHEKTALLLQQFMRQFSGNNGLNAADAYTLFMAQSDAVKTIFVNRHLSSELVNSALGFAKAGNHDRGYNALDTLYPTKHAGDILLFNSKISTNSGGSIDLIAPGGLINVGVPGRGGDDIGIITEKLGQIRAIADGDFSVNQSKVITQLGSDSGESDIAIWSTHGTIDAGRGSKTATSVPQRIVQTDVYGNTLVEVRGVATGSGIRAQSYDLDGPNGPLLEPKKGTVYLTAPRVDAGEAGIEAGDLVVVAPIVLNVGNIQVQGASSGVPVAAGATMAGVTAGVSPDAVNAAAAGVAQNAASAAANSSTTKPVLPSIISVDVIGIGR